MKMQWEILVVDDEEVMRESLVAWLREDGYGVDSAASGRDAIERAREKDYAIYFIDLKMPGGIDGIETMMEVKKIRRLPVIDENKRMVGMLSLGDISQAAPQRTAAQALRAVSAHHV